MMFVVQFVAAVVVTHIYIVNCQQMRWDPSIPWGRLSLEENTPAGINVFNISVEDNPPGSFPVGSVLYTIEDGKDYFRFRFSAEESTLGMVYVYVSPDYERVESIPFHVTAFHRTTQTSLFRKTSVSVTNINDLVPVFSQQRYSTYVSEEDPVGKIVFKFNVTDGEIPNKYMRVTCDRNHIDGSACDVFKLRFIKGSNILWDGELYLDQKLDYETKSFYQVPLVAEDGIFRQNMSMKITVNNTQDTPPEFIDIQSAAVPEEQIVGSIIQTIIAFDGDYIQGDAKGNKIHYEFAPKVTDVYQNLFEIGADDGIIRNKKVLDLENDPSVYPDGTFEVVVVAREIDKETGALGNTDKNSSRSTMRITITDINDNRPTFAVTNFEVFLPEDTPKDSTLTNVELNVEDRDVTKKYATFTLRLIPETNIFDLTVHNVERKTTANILVKNSTALDYETAPNRYILYVIATESGYPPTTATVTVNVQDANDNVPEFQPPRPYNVSINENRAANIPFITIRATDKDSGDFGTNGIVYSLSGAGKNLFQINPRSGEVSVAPCTTPGVKPCIDYEENKKYELGVTAVDSRGLPGYRSAYEILVIHILDVNDNVPKFPPGLNLTSFILETETEPNPPVIVKATDADVVGGDITYSLASGTDYWQIDSKTGVVTAKVPMKYHYTPGGRGFFKFTATATDLVNTVTTDIIIHVIDVNDNAPIFRPQVYRETISEGARGKTLEYILTVTATDADSATSSAGVINYNIEVGGQGKFNMNSSTGVLTTAEYAFFDYDVQKEYNMTIVARDDGFPMQSGTAYVIINIRDENNKNPYIKPQTRRADVYENVVVGTSVLQVEGIDPDDGAVLNYRFVEPKSAITPDGIEIVKSVYDFTNLFRINASNGMILTSAPLDRDKASVVTYTMEVVDITASPRQTGTGTLIITILEYNDQSPRFLPYKNVTIAEDQPTGTFVMALKAIDEDDAISEYRMFESPRNFFTIGMYTGVVVTTETIIDFEEIEETYFIVQVFDDGIPRLSATASVHVTITNVNDNSPIFDQPSYNLNLEENSPGGTSLLRVHATDRDKGHYGQVKYFLTDPLNRFYMNNETGEIFVSPGTVLDREQTPSIDILVTAYDSQLEPAVRRFTEVSIFLYLDDVNDNPPKFKIDEYIVRIPETIPINTEVIQVAATDLDLGANAYIEFSKVPNSGDPQNFFALNPTTGRVRVSKSLLRQTGTYKFQVMASDVVKYSTTANVTVIVFEAANSQPIWVIPPKTNMTIEVLESQYLGMLVYQVSARDEDRGTNGLIDYGFSVGNQTFTAVSPEFRINRITGVIRAERVFDREERDRYVLILVARDRGNPFLETQRSLTVVILDVNDNVPVFPQSSDGQTIPYRFQVSENAPEGHRINAVTATDADLNPKIYYYIIGGNEHETFLLNKTTGEIYLKKRLDREVQAIYRLYIQATNNVSDFTVITNRKKRELDPSIAEVVITVGNTNDVPPVFTQDRYHGCISEEAPVQQSILQVQAIDKDAYGIIRYRITQGNTGGALSIDPINGIITNNILMKNQENFVLDVQADDSAGGITLSAETAAKVLIFVTQKSKEVKLIIRQPASEVRSFIANYQTMLQKFRRENSDNRYFDYICFSDIRDHVLDDGQSTTLWSDVYLSAICANCFNRNYYIYTTDELLRELSQLKKDNKDTFDLLYIKDMEPAISDESYIDYMPTLVVMIIVILLFVLIIVFLIIACYCIYRSKSSRKKKALIHRHHVEEPTFEPVVVEKSVNPVYDNRGFDHEEPHAQYAQVLKRREMEPEQVPEPEPSPRYSDQGGTMEVEIKDDSSPERSPPDSPRMDPADEDYIIETQVL